MWYWSGMFVGKGDQSGRVSSFISAVVVVCYFSPNRYHLEINRQLFVWATSMGYNDFNDA